MSEEKGTGFSEEYVKELRQENASWRTKVRDLEQKQALNEVKTELLRKGVDVNPKWVEVREGQEVSEAVGQFLEDYPQFQTNPDTKPDPAPKTKPMNSGNSKNTNAPGPKPNNGSFGGRDINEIKKDPKARSALRGQYRQLLAQSSNKNYEGE